MVMWILHQEPLSAIVMLMVFSSYSRSSIIITYLNTGPRVNKESKILSSTYLGFLSQSQSVSQ